MGRRLIWRRIFQFLNTLGECLSSENNESERQEAHPASTYASCGSRLQVWTRNLNAEHGARTVHEFTLKHREVQRALDGLGCRRGGERSGAAFNFDNGRR